MFSLIPRGLISVALASPLLLAGSPASAQSLETFVLSVAGLSIGPGCSTYTTPAPVLVFFSVSGVSMPVPGFAACSIGGGMTDQTVALGPLMDADSFGSSWTTNTYSGSSTTTADYGVLSSAAHAQYSGDTSSSTVIGSEAFGRWDDTFTITSPAVADGQPGRLVLRITVSGGLSTTGTASADVELFLGVNASVPGVVFRSLATNAFGNAFVYSTTGTGLGGFSVGPGAMSGSGEISTVLIPFVFGTPVDLKLGLLSIAQPGLSSIVDTQFTATVSGLDVTLPGGIPVAEFVVSTASGTAYDAEGVGGPSVGRVPDGSGPEPPLTLQREPSGDLTLAWGDSCGAGDTDYEIYEGDMSDYSSHTLATCSTAGATVFTLPAPVGNAYYLVVATDGTNEGSYGVDSSGVPRLQGLAFCRPQAPAACGP